MGFGLYFVNVFITFCIVCKQFATIFHSCKEKGSVGLFFIFDHFLTYFLDFNFFWLLSLVLERRKGQQMFS
jgi:hypothetical protein